MAEERLTEEYSQTSAAECPCWHLLRTNLDPLIKWRVKLLLVVNENIFTLFSPPEFMP